MYLVLESPKYLQTVEQKLTNIRGKGPKIFGFEERLNLYERSVRLFATCKTIDRSDFLSCELMIECFPLFYNIGILKFKL